MYVLNNAPIINLYLDVNLSTLHWGHILPLIYIPTLEHFGVGNTPIAIPDFLDGVIGPLNLPSTYHNSSFLPALQILIAPPEYTLLFLKHCQLGFLPQLRTFELKPWKYEAFAGGAYKGERWHRDQFFVPIFEYLAGSDHGTGLRLKLYAMALISFIEWTLLRT
ncbi:hypothetical protein CPB83DRAFT_895405 [Crepidotus variabilis]|uniref:Uncharacterized protein n=1 Tax=Crepidotus variabilis TaxID=179855 RepID=A0A9P6EDF0_9AGAR|nr:hypothetical protein CPB83DRAFT_895405 [Crepidotus variabilis]